MSLAIGQFMVVVVVLGLGGANIMMLNFQIFLGEGPPFRASRFRCSQVRLRPHFVRPPLSSTLDPPLLGYRYRNDTLGLPPKEGSNP